MLAYRLTKLACTTDRCHLPRGIELILPPMPNVALTGVELGKENWWRKENLWSNGNWERKRHSSLD